MRYLFYIFLITNTLFTQGLITNPTELYLFNEEVKALKKNEIREELFLSPFIRKTPNKNKYYNIVQKLISNKNKQFVVEPIVSIRYGSSGLELSDINSSVYWLTPGFKMHSTIPIISDFTSIWMYSWTEFYKHSAVFDEAVVNPNALFKYNPTYSAGFYTGSVEPNNGMDFDQSHAGISLLSNNFEFIFGKFNTSFGPFSRGNLSLSNNAPPMDQVFIKLKHKKLIFSYVLGSLDSNIPRYSSETDVFDENHLYWDMWSLFNPALIDAGINPSASTILSNQLGNGRFSVWERYVAYHRIDFKIKDNIRIGAYEQIIFGARDIPMSYMIPILPFWSSQHESGDLDNLMLGFDFDILFGKKENIKNRFYGALLIDEWAPYSTFDKNNRNWFAYQIGYSRNGKILGKDLLYKMEYTRIDPRVYNHRFIINEPKHHGYNIGFWSGNHSDDFLMNLAILLESNRYIKFAYESTRFSNASFGQKLVDLENQYNDDYDCSDGNCYEPLSFLEHGYKYRGKLSLTFSTMVQYGLFFDLELSTFNTKDLYFKDKFNDITLKIRYNISK